LVEEFVPGPSVVNYPTTSDPIYDYIKILYQIASGISDIHRCNRIHRDIKPNNIKLDGENIVKILCLSGKAAWLQGAEAD